MLYVTITAFTVCQIYCLYGIQFTVYRTNPTVCKPYMIYETYKAFLVEARCDKQVLTKYI